MSLQASCPGCASPVQFDVSSSLIAVCSACNTLVGRGDGKLEDHGKVADLVPTRSPLQIGLTGKYKGVGYRITGRTQIQHAAGGIWDEWYVAFRDGKRWGWLAEAQGKLYLTFAKEIKGEHSIPSIDELDVDDEFMIPGVGSMTVTEIGESKVVAAEGELPFVPTPDESVLFADLSGSGSKFATLDYSGNGLEVYNGVETTFEKLGIADKVKDREIELELVGGVKVSCPSCAAPLELQAPDSSQRVACQYCGAMNECDNGNLRFLSKLDQNAIKPVIPLGSTGKLSGEQFGWKSDREYQVIGFLRKKTEYQGTNYFWFEYLLYRRRSPFVWLIHSEGHWSLGQPVPSGDVTAGPRHAKYDGRTFSLYERSKPEVVMVLGEFYWMVEVGETSTAADYIKPPETLSKETVRLTNDDSGGRAQKEINYTLSTYISTADVQEAFGLKELRTPTSIAPNQPYPIKGIWKSFGMLLGGVAVVTLLLLGLLAGGSNQASKKTYTTSVLRTQRTVQFEEPIKLASGKNIHIDFTATKWIYVAGELFNEKTGKVTEFGVENHRGVYLSALPAGDYTMKLKAEWENTTPTTARVPANVAAAMAKTSSPSFTITVKQGVMSWGRLILLMFVLGIIPVCVGIHQFTYSVRRWQESDYSPYAQDE